MYWLIENDKQIKYLINKKYQDVFIKIIPYNDNIHPILNNISLIYFKAYNDDKGYMLCVSHGETLSVNMTLINALISSIPNIWVQDKKQTLYYFPFKNINDLCLIDYKPPIVEYSNTHLYFQRKYEDNPELNKIIPIVKHYESCEKIYDSIKHKIKQLKPNHFEFYNNKVTIALLGIENNGINIEHDKFNKHFTPNNPIYSIQNDRIYPHYNIFTTTSRPSNSFNGINFSTLNKTNNSRESFIPSNDKFIEIDISAYHPTLASKIIDYKFQEPIYESFSKLLNIEISEAKKKFFNVMYGGDFDGLEGIEFFDKIKSYINKKWMNFNKNGYVECPISKFRFNKDEHNDMNPFKLFNFILQNVETSVNTIILLDIHKILRNKKTRLVLTVYDSFLFDYDEEEEETINLIKNIFEKYNFNIKIKEGYNYDFK